ncbi:MAG: hypothetical protein JWM28_2948 [Chitinophagaceae bacterium]|nr:hypothetical protein [Chitinophagaceae bacterium]
MKLLNLFFLSHVYFYNLPGKDRWRIYTGNEFNEPNI